MNEYKYSVRVIKASRIIDIKILSSNGIKALSATKQKLCEPPRDKTNKMAVRPAKTQLILGIRPI